MLARLGLAAVFLVSGWVKAVDPSQTVVAVRAYQLLPESLVRPVAVTLPVVELALGVLLVIGLGVRLVSVVSGLVLVVLIASIASAWARGLSIDCGCFGGGGEVADADPSDYAIEIARDVGFLALAAWLTVFPRSPFALGPRSRPVAPRRDADALAQ
nr:MauE/DoxX family redox-associated membrane protein [Rhodococcus sp. HNM0569]